MSPSIEDLEVLKNKMRDIYGELPEEVQMLFSKRNIDLLVRESGVEDLSEVLNKVEIILGDKFIKIKGIGNILFEALIPYLNFIKVSYANNKFKILMSKRKNWINDLQEILKCLVSITKGNIVKEIV